MNTSPRSHKSFNLSLFPFLWTLPKLLKIGQPKILRHVRKHCIGTIVWDFPISAYPISQGSIAVPSHPILKDRSPNGYQPVKIWLGLSPDFGNCDSYNHIFHDVTLSSTQHVIPKPHLAQKPGTELLTVPRKTALEDWPHRPFCPRLSSVMKWNSILTHIYRFITLSLSLINYTSKKTLSTCHQTRPLLTWNRNWVCNGSTCEQNTATPCKIYDQTVETFTLISLRHDSKLPFNTAEKQPLSWCTYPCWKSFHFELSEILQVYPNIVLGQLQASSRAQQLTPTQEYLEPSAGTSRQTSVELPICER